MNCEQRQGDLSCHTFKIMPVFKISLKNNRIEYFT